MQLIFRYRNVILQKRSNRPQSGLPPQLAISLPVLGKVQGRLIYFRLLFLSMQASSEMRKVPKRISNVNTSYVLMFTTSLSSQGGSPPCNTTAPIEDYSIQKIIQQSVFPAKLDTKEPMSLSTPLLDGTCKASGGYRADSQQKCPNHGKRDVPNALYWNIPWL